MKDELLDLIIAILWEFKIYVFVLAWFIAVCIAAIVVPVKQWIEYKEYRESIEGDEG